MQNIIGRRGFVAGAFATIAVATLAGGPLVAQTMDPAARVIQTYYVTLFTAVQAAKDLGPAARAQRIAPAIMSAFDMVTMTRLAVGPPWSRFSAAQQSTVRDLYGKFVLADYAKQLGEYKGEAYKVEPVSEARGSDRIVRTVIGGTKVNYLVRGSHIIDVYANGTVSEMATRRAEFTSILASGGAEALIEHLRQKIQQLGGD